MRVWVGAAAALLLALLCARPATAQVGGEAVLFARAETFFRAGDLERAAAVLDRVIGSLEERVSERPPSDEERLLLVRSLTYRALAAWRLQQRDDIDRLLDRIVELAPDWSLQEYGAEPELADRFERRRARQVGFLQVTVLPPEARVFVDGRPVEPLPEVLPVLAGEHTVRAEQAGYAPGEEGVRVRSGRTVGVALQLERVSATVRLRTSPPGAEVALDGRAMGVTVADEQDPQRSQPLLIEGLIPGSHELVVTLAEHRTFRQTVQVPGLADYDLGLVRLERSMGTVFLRGLPAGSEVRIDGQPAAVEFRAAGGPAGAGMGRLSLPVGAHEIRVTHPEFGVYEGRVGVGDGSTTSVDVALRPGLALFGVVGGDRLDREAVLELLRDSLAGTGQWFLLDRSGATEELLRAAGLRPRALAGADGELLERIDWAALQRAAERAAPGALFLLARKPEGGERGRFELLLWPASPGPARPDRLVLRLGDKSSLEPLVRALAEPLPAPRAWLGAVVADSLLAEAPTVMTIDPRGPAARAGLRVGDRITALDGAPLEHAEALVARVQRAAPFSTLALQVQRGERLEALALTLGASPVSVHPRASVPAAVVWAAARARERRGDSDTPGWTLRLDQALILLQASAWEEAVRLLETVRAPEEAPFGAAAVEYWLGVAHAGAGPGHETAAQQAFERALGRTGGRLEHDDGPLVAPRARARLTRLRANIAHR